ncbi:transposase, partial [Paenibacillus sp. tmac-D7]|uniref:IS110 family transposase n=1 Tax=Paenibacillus sp. tmac-D7 TaxID=2591462 RepID=UPI001142C08A
MATIDRTKYLFVGVDLHKKNHVAVLCNCFSDIIKSFTFKNAPTHFPTFITNLKKHAEGKDVIFGLEDVNFYGRSLAKFLISEGYLVKEVNSSYTKKKRNRGTNRNKTDKLDARAICKNLIDEYDAHPIANPQDIYLAIKQTLSTRNNYVQMVANMKISLHNLLVHHYPNYTDFFQDLDSKTSRGFFETYPSPEMLEGISSTELTTSLKKYNKSVPKNKAQEILDAVSSNGWLDNGYK